MEIADIALMRTVLLALFALLLPLVFVIGCSSPFAGDTLVARQIEGEPGKEDWELAVPLDLKVWMGNVNMSDEIVTLDMETSHRSTPDCHHGPSTSDPVDVRIQAIYNLEELYVLLKWPDQTQDLELGTWEMGPEGWSARPGADDGIAILWEPLWEPVGEPAGEQREGAGSRRKEDAFRCQYACHMMEVDVYDGGTKMRLGMKAPDGQVLDLWRWRASVTGVFGLADDMVIDEKGKRGDEGQVLLRENRATESIGPERRPERMGSPGSEGYPAVPYYILEAPVGRQGDVKAEARWEDGVWHLLLKRALDTADPDDVSYSPGTRVPFSVSVFDNTFNEHHVSGGSAVLVLWQDRVSSSKRRDLNEPMDF